MSNGLDVALMNDPHGDWSPENGDWHLDIEFNEDEWGSFFFDALRAVKTEYVEGEPIGIYDARRVANFLESLKDYPLLARIHDFYEDASFTADEVASLERELRRAEKLKLDSKAQIFLEGMLKACETAAKEKLGISLLSS